MDINLFVIGLLTAVIGLYSWKAYLHMDDAPPSKLPWVPIDVNKHRSFVNQTRDAGMFVERQRRSAILSNQSHAFSNKSSTNGYLEYSLTGILVGDPPAPCPIPYNVVWSADGDVCEIVDSGGAFGMYDAIDFGGAAGNDCDV